MHHPILIIVFFVFSLNVWGQDSEYRSDILVPELRHADNLVLWSAFGGYNSFDSLNEQYRHQFGQELSIVFFGVEDLKGDLLFAADAEILPDAVIVPSDFLGLHQDYRFQAIDKENFPQSERGNSKDAYFGYPITTGNFLLLYYNKLLVSNPASSWDELFQQAQQLSEKGIQAITWQYRAPFYFLPFYYAFGGNIETNEALKLNNEAMLSALKSYKEIVEQADLIRFCGRSCDSFDFLNGQVAYTIDGDWNYREFKRALGDNLGVAAIPAIKGHAVRGLSSNYVIAFPKNKKESEANRKQKMKSLIEFFNKDKTQTHIFHEYGLYPASIDPNSKLNKRTSEFESQFFTLLNDSISIQSHASISFMWSALSNNVLAVLQDQIGIEKAAYNIDAETQELAGKFEQLRSQKRVLK
ncbi:extracellular solute-binding protein [Paraneptunicella aestuarii]|uniref:sugar ABC transporter substrate-binding protein n=1 Tax=Paraneptunicella aestuarii TaxID=2831148 RepID=UPI001E36858D|nr:extracellular solute-binding protein [Paraneptunicella aestuarii]UAA37267.1 extracellular solute-binding protein [Paraneptunicella aestuarii]